MNNELSSPIALLHHLYFLPPLMLLFLFAYAWPKRKVPIMQAFMALLLSGAIYSLAYALQGFSSSFEMIRFWNRIEYIGIATLPSCWLLLALRYSGYDHWVEGPMRAILIGIPALTYFFNATTEWLGLCYRAMEMVHAEGITRLSFTPGPWYYVHIAYINIATLAGILLLVAMLRKGGSSGKSLRVRTLFMIAGAVAPWGTHLWYLSGTTPQGLDAAPFGVILSGICYAIGLFRLGMLDIVPIARDQAFDAISEAVIVFDMRHRLIDYNPAATTLVPQILHIPLGAPVSEALIQFPMLIEQVVDGLPGIEFELPNDRGTRYLFARFDKIRNRFGTEIGGILMLSDITERELLMQRLEEMAVYDSLTGLFNRRAFMDHFEGEIDRAVRHRRPLSLLMLDIDHFKTVNDTYGHQAGDMVLRAVATICQETVRSHDVVGRYGGEEIAVLLGEACLSDALSVAERIRVRIADAKVDYGEAHLKVTTSVGAASLDTVDPKTCDALIKAADTALYRAKNEGRNRVCSA